MQQLIPEKRFTVWGLSQFFRQVRQSTPYLLHLKMNYYLPFSTCFFFTVLAMSFPVFSVVCSLSISCIIFGPLLVQTTMLAEPSQNQNLQPPSTQSIY
jgi:hypothetical protein